jgi:hypothetical protein
VPKVLGSPSTVKKYRFNAQVAPEGVTVACKEFDGRLMNASYTSTELGNATLDSTSGNYVYNNEPVFVDNTWIGMSAVTVSDSSDPGYDGNVYYYQEVGFYILGVLMRKVGVRYNNTKGEVDSFTILV